MTHFVYLRRIKRARTVTRTCAIDARLPDTIVSAAIVCKVTKATETTDVSVSASVYTRPMISCVRVCLPNRGAAPFTPVVRVVVRTNCAIAYMSTWQRYDCAVQCSLAATTYAFVSISRSNTQRYMYHFYRFSLSFLRARANLICLKSNSCMRLSRCEA